jgi:hypothetical protein
LKNQRAQGMPGARRARSLAWCIKNTRVSHHGRAGSPGIPRAMVLTVSFVLSPVIGLSCHRRPADDSAKLDAGVEASGPHDFAVREKRLRLWRCPRPPHPASNVRDDRETPLRGSGTESQYSCFYLDVKRNSENPKLAAACRMG